MCRLRRQCTIGVPAPYAGDFCVAQVTKTILPRGLRSHLTSGAGNLGLAVASVGPPTAHP